MAAPLRRPEALSCLSLDSMGPPSLEVCTGFSDSVSSQGREDCLEMKPLRFQNDVVICPLIRLLLYHIYNITHITCLSSILSLGSA